MSVCCVQWRTLTDSDQRPADRVKKYKYENTRENTYWKRKLNLVDVYIMTDDDHGV
jgi:hypothetical protein